MSAVFFEDTSLLISWEVRTEKDGSLVTDSDPVTVEAFLYDPEDGTAITKENGNSVNPVSLSYNSDEEEWQGVIPSDVTLEAGDRVDIKYVVDGGAGMKDTEWDRDTRVRERDADR